MPPDAVFVDSSFLIGRFLQADQWHRAAHAAASEVVGRSLVVSEGVFQEFLAHVSRRSAARRYEATSLVQDLYDSPRAEVVTHARPLVLRAVSLYGGEFLHSRFSLQDCIAVQIMRDFGITEILSADAEFAVAGFTPLMIRYA